MNTQIDPKALGFKETDRGYRLDYGDSFFGFLMVANADIPAKKGIPVYITPDGERYAIYDQAKCDYINITTMILRVHKYGQEAGITLAQRAVEKVLRNTTAEAQRAWEKVFRNK